jgi:hypothetical protein
MLIVQLYIYQGIATKTPKGFVPLNDTAFADAATRQGESIPAYDTPTFAK